ncbi:MAG: hypothetical protein AAF621_06215 [Pseudomonadota bacterium]
MTGFFNGLFPTKRKNAKRIGPESRGISIPPIITPKDLVNLFDSKTPEHVINAHLRELFHPGNPEDVRNANLKKLFDPETPEADRKRHLSK